MLSFPHNLESSRCFNLGDHRSSEKAETPLVTFHPIGPVSDKDASFDTAEDKPKGTPNAVLPLLMVHIEATDYVAAIPSNDAVDVPQIPRSPKSHSHLKREKQRPCLFFLVFLVVMFVSCSATFIVNSFRRYPSAWLLRIQ